MLKDFLWSKKRCQSVSEESDYWNQAEKVSKDC